MSVKRDRAREIELLRQHYARHRETLSSLANEAPSDHLASEYHRLVREIDAALGKLGELEGRVPADTNPAMRTETGTTAATLPPPLPRTEPGSRPLRTPPSAMATEIEPATPSSIGRIAAIIGAGVIVLVIIGALMWKASGERPMTTAQKPVTQTTAAAPGPITPAPKPAPVAAGLTIAPPAQDYGTIRKGTRAVRQFQVTNNGDQPVTIQVERSKCRCLYYEYPKSIAPHAKQTVTVTVDAAKAKAGALQESVAVSAKGDPSVSGTMQVNAVVR